MDFIKLAEDRYSVRKFDSRTIEADVIERLLHAAHMAPTACNYQPQRILVVESAEAIEKLKGCTRCHFDAPCAMLVCFSKDECWKRKYDGAESGWVDASIVATHIMMAAKSLGIGTTWVMHFDPLKMREAFNIPEGVVPVALLPMGYPAEDAEPLALHTTYRNMEEVVKYNSFK
ncbi:MAG: nitroreductase family protein [Clostridia bacterium]|nr:nitroreductase family protein [Clostridia bacterium]